MAILGPHFGKTRFPSFGVGLGLGFYFSTVLLINEHCIMHICLSSWLEHKFHETGTVLFIAISQGPGMCLNIVGAQ